MTVKCKADGNPLRTVDVVVTQSYPETPYPQGANGVGAQNVVCNGAEHSVAVTVPPGLFDAGWAYATATLDPAAMPATATSSRSIYINHV